MFQIFGWNYHGWDEQFEHEYNIPPTTLLNFGPSLSFPTKSCAYFLPFFSVPKCISGLRQKLVTNLQWITWLETKRGERSDKCKAEKLSEICT